MTIVSDTATPELSELLEVDSFRALKRTAALGAVTWDTIRESGKLLPQHIAYCQSRGLHPFFVQKRGYVSVGAGTKYTVSLPDGVSGFSDEQIAWLLGNDGKKTNSHSTLLIPLYSTAYKLDEESSGEDVRPVLYQARPDKAREVPTEWDDEGKVKKTRRIKFEAPAGAKRGTAFGKLPIDVNPALHTALYRTEPSPVVVLTEGIHKADAINSHAALEGLSVVAAAATGVTMPYFTAGTKENPKAVPVLTGAMDALGYVNGTWADEPEDRTPRTILLAWDADWRVNPGVYTPLITTAKLLADQGVTVRIVNVPPVDGDIKTGIDDYLAYERGTGNENALRALLEESIDLDEAKFLTIEYTFDDAGRGDRLAAWVKRYGTHLYNVDRKMWMVYDAETGVWKNDDEMTISKLAVELTTYDEITYGKNESRSRRAIEAAIALARAVDGVHISENDLDDPSIVAKLLCVKNGVVDLENGALLPHSPIYRMTQKAKFAYDPTLIPIYDEKVKNGYSLFEAVDEMGAPNYANYLRTALYDADRARTLQESVGTMFIGKVMEEVMYWWYSSGGRSGKGITLELLQNHILGDYETTLRPEAIVSELKDEHLISTKGHRAVIMQETGDGSVLNTTALKQLASRDKVSGRALFKNRENFRPSHTLFAVTNHLPIVYDTDAGTWDRMILLTFPHTFVKGVDRIEDLSDRVELEAPVIAAWFVYGAMQVIRNATAFRGAEVEAEKEAWRNQSDTLGEFLVAECEVGEGFSEKRSDMYRAYSRHCRMNDLGELSVQSFVRKLQQRREFDPAGTLIPIGVKKSGEIKITGVRLRTNRPTGKNRPVR